MTAYRAKFTHENITWITHGYTREEAMFRMRDAVHRWVVTTGNPWPMGEVKIVEITDPTPTPPNTP